MYNIEQCAKELAQTSYEHEAAKIANKHFRVFRKNAGKIDIALNKRGAMQVIAECLSNRVGGDTPNGIDLRYYAGDYSRRVVPYKDADEITVEELNSEESADLNATLEWLLIFSKAYSPEFYYMIEWGNGYDEITAVAYNFYAYTQHEGEMPEDMPEFAPKWIGLVFPYLSDSVKRDIEYEKAQRARREEFFNAYKIIFDNCLNFNIDMGIDNEKPGGIAEQTAIEFIDSLGGYNGFTPSKFEKIIRYCNKHFIAHYGAGNCNNGKKDYKISFGRENSVVMYLSTFFKSDDEISATLDELSEIASPDELTVEEKHESFYKGKTYAKIRLWWD